MTQSWADVGIDTRDKTHGSIRVPCPKCSPFRKKQTYPCLHADLDKEVWCCHHCGFSGSLQNYGARQTIPPPVRKAYTRPTYEENGLSAKALKFFADRGISEAVVRRNRIGYGPVYMPQDEDEVATVQFPYYRDGEAVNIKYRDGHKHFRMVSGAERLLYGLDDIDGDSVIVVEGEMDKLALEMAGYTSVVSVPDGAPAPNTKNYESKFDFLASAEEVLRPLARIVIAVDNDGPGNKLAEELARRLGQERCLRVRWSSECKDANDVLMSHGPKVLAECVEAAEPWPVRGIITVAQVWDLVTTMYHTGIERGVAPHWPSVAHLYRVKPGELTIVSGIPSHGKSYFINDLVVGLAKQYDWQCAFYSPEHGHVKRHVVQLLEQYLGEAFDGYADRMSEAAMHAGLGWMQEHFTFLAPDRQAPTIEHLLDLARIQVYRQGIKGLILDPWNQIAHPRDMRDSETNYVSEVISQVQQFDHDYDVHTWLIVHPTKLRKAEKGEYAGQYPPPTPYDAAGSAHFRNKTDNFVTVWRNLDDDDFKVQIHVQKIKFKENGRLGKTELMFNPKCGQYREVGDMTQPHWNDRG